MVNHPFSVHLSFSYSTYILTQEQETWTSHGSVAKFRWAHVAAVFNGSHIIGFQDGVEREQSNGFSPENNAPGTGHVHVGEYALGIYHFLVKWPGVMLLIVAQLTFPPLSNSKLRLSYKPQDGRTGLLEQSADC